MKKTFSLFTFAITFLCLANLISSCESKNSTEEESENNVEASVEQEAASVSISTPLDLEMLLSLSEMPSSDVISALEDAGFEKNGKSWKKEHYEFLISDSDQAFGFAALLVYREIPMMFIDRLLMANGYKVSQGEPNEGAISCKLFSKDGQKDVAIETIETDLYGIYIE